MGAGVLSGSHQEARGVICPVSDYVNFDQVVKEILSDFSPVRESYSFIINICHFLAQRRHHSEIAGEYKEEDTLSDTVCQLPGSYKLKGN